MVIPFQDLVIGVTAREFGYAVATANVRHFRMIPNLAIASVVCQKFLNSDVVQFCVQFCLVKTASQKAFDPAWRVDMER